MLRLPVLWRPIVLRLQCHRCMSSSSFIRNTFIEYFKDHGHKYVKSSPVVPLCDPTVPFVNAGMVQFKGVFLGTVEPPSPRVVNSQKCVRVGGKHNDLDVVGTDGYHHTFFEMLGNWSFGDYDKKEACKMAWNLLLGAYGLKPENLVVTYFGGDVVIGLQEDRECRDIWKSIGVPSSRIRPMEAKDNFWEMGSIGPCGPCTEIHYENPDGTLTELWNIVFIHCKREADNKVKDLRKLHIDTGMGLERMAALLQGVPSSYDTDLFQPIIKTIEQNSKGVAPYGGKYSGDAVVDTAYRRLADHARMISVCLADQVYPSNSLNLKQILRKSFKISSDIFNCPTGTLTSLYDRVAESLSPTYPELERRMKEAKLIMEYEEQSYVKLRSDLTKKWRKLVKNYPEVEDLSDIELSGFALGYTEFKETMTKINSNQVPGELIFKLYDTHGFQEEMIERIAKLNQYNLDTENFYKILAQHKSRHKTAFKEQSQAKNDSMFNNAVDTLVENGITRTNDQFKYDYKLKNKNVVFRRLNTKLFAIINENGDWIDCLDPCETKPYYLVTQDTNFYVEEGGQTSDVGIIKFDHGADFKVDSVFKIRNFVFYKGHFGLGNVTRKPYITLGCDVKLEIDSVNRLKIMSNHTAVHLLNAAIRKVLPDSVVCQVGSKVSDMGLSLNLSVYGEKLSQDVVMKAQELIRAAIKSDVAVGTSVVDSVQLSTEESVLTVPGETYPEVGLRLVTAQCDGLISKELCCGTHVPRTGLIGEFCVTSVKGAGSNTPQIHALTGENATQARDLFCRASKLNEFAHLIDPDRMKQEVNDIKQALTSLCGTGGAPYGEYAECLVLLDNVQKKASRAGCLDDNALQSLVWAEIEDLTKSPNPHFIHFVRCSYLFASPPLNNELLTRARRPLLLLACANGVIHAAAHVPHDKISAGFTADQWLGSILPVFSSSLEPTEAGVSPLSYAQMSGTKVSLITCEQLVSEAMKIATEYANEHNTKVDKKTVPREEQPYVDTRDDRKRKMEF